MKAAVQFLRLAETTFGTDAIVLQGHSAGARLGGIVLTTPEDEAFDSPILWRSVADAVDGFVGFYGYYNGYQFWPDSYYGPASLNRFAADAIANATQASGPALLIHGTEDPLLEPEASITFAEALIAADRDVEVELVVGQQHSFDQHLGQLSAAGRVQFDRIIQWLTDGIDDVRGVA